MRLDITQPYSLIGILALRRIILMGGMKAISGGMGLSHEDAKPRDESIPN